MVSSFADTDTLSKAASEHDIVINAGTASDVTGSLALLKGLEQRKKKSGQDVYFIHTSGASSLGDQPITGNYAEKLGPRVFNDLKDDIYAYEKMRNEAQQYNQREVDIAVVDKGEEYGVKTFIIKPPLIYGLGSGQFNKLTAQVPAWIRTSIKLGHSFVVGDGQGKWDYVHIDDLVVLYTLVLERILDGATDLTFGKRAMIFCGAGRFRWADVGRSVADALYEAGRIQTKEVKSLSLEEVAELSGFPALLVEVGLASNSMGDAAFAREVLGWRPARGEGDWKGHFGEEVEAVVSA